jgi:hypothetical protein
MTRWFAVIGCLLGCAAPEARGWDDQGHMMVAAIAWEHLTDASRARVSILLRLNPDYVSWVGDSSAARGDQIAFIRAATWADAIKTEAGYQNDGTVPDGASAARNIGYDDHLQHRYWHFIDLPITSDDTRIKAPQTPNLKTQLAMLSQALAAANTSENVRSYDLVWLEHLVGDAHQPLHAVSRFSRQLPGGDEGGNLVTLCRHPCRNELHAFWDDLPGTSRSVATAISSAQLLQPAPAAEAADLDQADWLQESVAAAQQYVYIAPVGAGGGPYALDDAYRRNARGAAMKRIALAGARLAGLINAALRQAAARIPVAALPLLTDRGEGPDRRIAGPEAGETPDVRSPLRHRRRTDGSG